MHFYAHISIYCHPPYRFQRTKSARSALHHPAIPPTKSCTCKASSFAQQHGRLHAAEARPRHKIYIHPCSSVHLVQREGKARLRVACLASAAALPRSSFCLCSQGFCSFLATVGVSDRAELAAVPVRRLHQPQTAPRTADPHRVAHTASSLLSAKAPGGVSMRTEPAAVSKLPGHHTATLGAFAETRHCSRAGMYLLKEMFAARSAN